MKFLFLSQFFSSTRGGGEHLFYVIIKQLLDNGNQVWIITNKIIGEEYPSHKNMHIIFVPPNLKYQGGLPPSIKDNLQYFFNAAKIGYKVIKENDIDIIHSNNFTPSFVGSFLAFFSSKNHITSVWDVFTLCGCDYWKKWVEQSGVSKFNQIIGPIFEKLVFKIKCSAYHTISDASKNDMIEFGAKKPIYQIAPYIEGYQREEVPKKNNQFIYVGRLVFYKNVEILIKAMKIVNEKNDAKLVIVGNGPQLEHIQNLIEKLNLQNKVFVKGYVSTDEKFRLISESNAMLFPSLCEGFGLVILEAFSQKRPVLVSDIRPMSDIITNEQTGFVLKSNNEDAWAQHILRLIQNPQESEIMGKNANKEYNQKYNQEVFYEKLIKMYEKVLTRNP